MFTQPHSGMQCPRRAPRRARFPRRARRASFLAQTPAVSLARGTWVNCFWLRSIGPNPLGLASVRAGNHKSRSIGSYLTRPAFSERMHKVQFDILTWCH